MTTRSGQPDDSGSPVRPASPLAPAARATASPLGSSSAGTGGSLGAASGIGGTNAAAHWLGMFARSKWWILAIFMIVAGTALPCIWTFVKPTYRARAVVRVSPIVSRVVFKTEDNGIVPLYRSYLNTQVSVISSPTVLQRVLDRADVRQTKWYREPPFSPLDLLRTTPEPMERLRDVLMVSPRRDTELIDIGFVAQRRGDAVVVVDAIVEEYKKLSDETSQETEVQRSRTLLDERNALQRQIDGLVDIKHKASKHLGTMTAEELRSMLTKNLTGLEAEYQGLKRELSLARWELQNLESRRKGSDGTDTPQPGGAEEGQVDATQRYAMDGDWRRLNLELRSARHQLDLARQHYGESHPRIQTLTSGMEFAERNLREREAQLDEVGHVAAPQIPAFGGAEVMTVVDRSSLEMHVQRLEYQSRLLEADVEAERDRVANVGDVAQDMAHYDEEIKNKRDLLDSVRLRITQLEMESKAPGRISVAARASASSQPFRDRRLLLSVMSLGGALMLGLAVAYLRIITDSKIREVDDVQHAVRVPFLGKLPPLPHGKGLLAECDPAIMENVRMVRTALLQRLTGCGKQVILVTSSSSRAGKSSVAILLCRSLAQLGKRTLLVEADLHRPSLGGYLGLSAKRGLAHMLTDRLDDSDVIIPAEGGGFDVLPAGDRVDDFNFELLANGVFSGCLQRWKQRYDYVVVDSPPFLPVADSRILAGQADGTIMVLRSAHCRRNEVIQAYADLSAGGGTLLGTVLVGAQVGSGYGYYADYRRTGTVPRLPSDGSSGQAGT